MAFRFNLNWRPPGEQKEKVMFIKSQMPGRSSVSSKAYPGDPSLGLPSFISPIPLLPESSMTFAVQGLWAMGEFREAPQ